MTSRSSFRPARGASSPGLVWDPGLSMSLEEMMLGLVRVVGGMINS
ncbi:MAG: hypothetical protein LBP95_03825 [Deltaproteobacteria bacterium]|nr:hypothetical protein [Deltaproteobacteria bacterium]